MKLLATCFIILSLLGISDLFPMRAQLARGALFLRNYAGRTLFRSPVKNYTIHSSIGNPYRNRIFSSELPRRNNNYYRNFSKHYLANRASFDDQSDFRNSSKFSSRAPSIAYLIVPGFISDWLFYEDVDKFNIEELLKLMNMESEHCELPNDFKKKLNWNKRLQKKCIQLLENHIVILMEECKDGYRFQDFIKTLCKNKDNENSIRKILLDNFEVIMDFADGSNHYRKKIRQGCALNLIEDLLIYVHTFDCATFSDYHYRVISTHAKNSEGYNLRKLLIADILNQDSSRDKFLGWIKRNLNEISEDTLEIISKFEKIDDLCISYMNESNGNYIDRTLKKRVCHTQCPQLPIHPETCHERHLFQNKEGVLVTFLANKYKKRPELASLVERINEKTKELQNDYYVFVHGQDVKFYALQELYNDLRAMVENCDVRPEFRYIWFVEPTNNINEEEKLHEKVLEGNQNSKTIFMNYGFFAHPNNRSCLAYHVLHNSNRNERSVDQLYDIFNTLGLRSVYAKYEEKLKNHISKFNNMSNYGNVLLIAVPKHTISRSVYVSDDTAKRKNIYVGGWKRSDDIALIMKAWEKNPLVIQEEDGLQFCLVMTQSPNGGGLNPKSGIKIIPFNCIAKEKLEEFEQEKNELLAQMKDDILAARNRA